MSTATLDAPTAAQRASSRPRRRGGARSNAKATWSASAMLFPAALLLVVFLLIPIGLTFALAFTDARLISPEPARWIGLANFTRLFGDSTFWRSLFNTVVFALVIVPGQSGAALVLAVLVNGKVRGTSFFRTIYFLPVVTSMVVVSMLWLFMYQPDGLINQALSHVGITGPDWLGNTHTALLAIIVMSAWQAMGMHMVVWLSGLQTIPGELYEAAAIDGASKWQQFWHVTWPGLRQTRAFILITITIAAFSLFTQVNIMTQGGPTDHTSTVVLMAVRTGFAQQQTGYASAISLVFFAIVFTVSMAQRHLTRDKEPTR